MLRQFIIKVSVLGYFPLHITNIVHIYIKWNDFLTNIPIHIFVTITIHTYYHIYIYISIQFNQF